MTAYDTLFLSPHLDDAVLSCGGFIHRLTSEGKRVLVATVFSGDLVDACGAPRATSDAVGQVLAMMDLPLGEAMARRRREDERACARLGAELLHLDLPEALVRVGVDGQAIYGSVGSLFGAVDPRDAPFLETVVEAFRDLPPAPCTSSSIDRAWGQFSIETVSELPVAISVVRTIHVCCAEI